MIENVQIQIGTIKSLGEAMNIAGYILITMGVITAIFESYLNNKGRTVLQVIFAITSGVLLVGGSLLITIAHAPANVLAYYNQAIEIAGLIGVTAFGVFLWIALFIDPDGNFHERTIEKLGFVFLATFTYCIALMVLY